MQQNMQYRHHGGGSYGPNQNQYGQAVNQDLYRSNHPGYAGNNNRIPTKAWTDNNNSNDLMPPYGQGSSHPQMMNNPPQMPVTAMRSPPHAAASMNQGAPQGQQHFRPMQSPAHSPHSWSQAQIPSPGMMHSPRTSPLPAHVRSPGHSQPFSPPAAHSINMPPHQPPQENGQISQSMNSSNDNPTNPLHSLQKMVLLEQDPKAMMGLPGNANEQYQNQCGSHSFVPEDGITNDSTKESQYSTYYNMDENRFESKPNNDSNDSAVYSSAHPMTNCNFPVPPHPSSNETDLKNIARVPGNLNPNIPEAFHSSSNQNSVPLQISSALEQSHCKSSIPQNDCTLKQNECPPHAESAPVFTDQTKAAVSTNTEQALESKSSSNWVTDASDPEKASVAQASFSDAAGIPHSSISQERCVAFQPSPDNSSKETSSKESEISTVNNDKSSCKDHESYSSKEFKLESDIEKNNQAMQNPSICTLSSESQDCDSNITSSDSKSCSSYEDSHSSEKKNIDSNKIDDSYEDAQSLGVEDRSNSQPESCNPKTSSNESRSSSNPSPSSNDKNDIIDSHSIARTPVKVVIHRIRKSDTQDTWHVPGNTAKTNESENLTESKPSTGPQIIMLSQSLSEKSSSASSSATDQNVGKTDVNSPITIKEEPMDSPEKNSNTEKLNSNTDKKRGRPAGSKNRMKASVSTGGKNKRGKKGTRKKKGENSKQKQAESASKVKKVSKAFNGPYIHITGNKDNPSAISVVNVAQKEDEKLSKTQTKRNVSTAVSRIKNKTVGHLSTLSPTYDAYNRDKTWVCIFCQKGSHHGGLGDLYGPYYIKNNFDEKHSPSTSGTCASRNKRKRSETEDSKMPKKTKQVILSFIVYLTSFLCHLPIC